MPMRIKRIGHTDAKAWAYRFGAFEGAGLAVCNLQQEKCLPQPAGNDKKEELDGLGLKALCGCEVELSVNLFDGFFTHQLIDRLARKLGISIVNDEFFGCVKCFV